MSEEGFIAFQNIVGSLIVLICAGSLAYFFYPFMTKEREQSKSKQKKVFIVFAIYSLVYFAGMTFFMWEGTRMLLTLVILTAASKYLDMDRKKCFLLITFVVCIRNISPIMTESLYYVLNEKFVRDKTQVEVIFRNTAVVFCIYIIATMVIYGVMSYRQMAALQEEKEKYFVEEQQIRALQEHIREVEQFYTGIRQIRHEMKNHLTNIKGLAESGRYEGMEQYIAKMDAGLNAFELTVKTGNAVTDVIVNDKKKAADRLGIKFQTEFIYPQSNKYNAYDVGIILNNLLTNALEACEKISEKGERYIILSGRQKRKFFLIEVKNPYEGEIEFDNKTDFPVSTKQNDNSLHGIGLSNVKREVEKYMGDMKINVKKNEFCVTVLLQESPAKKCQGLI